MQRMTWQRRTLVHSHFQVKVKISLEPCSYKVKDLTFVCSQLLVEGLTDAHKHSGNSMGSTLPHPCILPLQTSLRNLLGCPASAQGPTSELWLLLNWPIFWIPPPQIWASISLETPAEVPPLVPGVDSLLWAPAPQTPPPITHTVFSPPSERRQGLNIDTVTTLRTEDRVENCGNIITYDYLYQKSKISLAFSNQSKWIQKSTKYLLYKREPARNTILMRRAHGAQKWASCFTLFSLSLPAHYCSHRRPPLHTIPHRKPLHSWLLRTDICCVPLDPTHERFGISDQKNLLLSRKYYFWKFLVRSQHSLHLKPAHPSVARPGTLFSRGNSVDKMHLESYLTSVGTL